MPVFLNKTEADAARAAGKKVIRISRGRTAAMTTKKKTSDGILQWNVCGQWRALGQMKGGEITLSSRGKFLVSRHGDAEMQSLLGDGGSAEVSSTLLNSKDVKLGATTRTAPGGEDGDGSS